MNQGQKRDGAPCSPSKMSAAPAIASERRLEVGFTLIELLIVIAVIGILASLVLTAIGASRDKAYDTRIRNGVGQLRLMAEQVYDTQGADFTDWTQYPDIQTNLAIVLEDIDKNYGDAAGTPYVTLIRDSQAQDFCISAPLRSLSTSYYCVDTTGVFKTSTAACPDYPAGGTPLRCP